VQLDHKAFKVRPVLLELKVFKVQLDLKASKAHPVPQD
jgi:hypothetical protein